MIYIPFFIVILIDKRGGKRGGKRENVRYKERYKERKEACQPAPSQRTTTDREKRYTTGTHRHRQHTTAREKRYDPAAATTQHTPQHATPPAHHRLEERTRTHARALNAHAHARVQNTGARGRAGVVWVRDTQA